MKRILGSLILAGAFLAGCSSDNGSTCTKKTCGDLGANCGTPSDNCGGTLSCGTCGSGLTCGTGSNNSVANVCGFAQPAGTVPVEFSVDDTANKQWKSEELEWKGAMLYDTTTRKITFDSNWAGPWAKLYDDGPWNKGGHEGATATAGDHKLGTTVFVAPPAAGAAPQKYEYGLRDATNPDTQNGGWVWVGSNGSFTVNPGATATLTAQGLTFPAHGTIDLKVTLDTHNLDSGGTWDTSAVFIKGSGWGWSDVQTFDDGTHGDDTAGDGIYTFVLTVTAADLLAKPPYPGPFNHGDKPEFVWDLGAAKKEYKVNSICSKVGVKAYTKPSGGSFTEQTLDLTGGTGLGSGNTFITVP